MLFIASGQKYLFLELVFYYLVSLLMRERIIVSGGGDGDRIF